MEQPLVSIALCTYNGEKFLREQLDTLVYQTYPNLEIIAVDDCSKDGTVSILKEYQYRFSFIKIYQNEKNLGFAKNFEKAISLCSGDLIALSDQDDIWSLDKIALQVSNIGDNIFIYHDSEFIREDGSLMNKSMSDIVNLYRGNQPEVFLFFNCISGHSMLIKRKLLEIALPFKNQYFHDWWLAYVATNVGKIDFIDQCLVKYRQHEASDTNILRIERKKTDKHSSLTSVEKIEKQLQWLQHCKDFNQNKNQPFVSKLHELFKLRVHQLFIPELTVFMLKNRKVLFQIQKKSDFSKLNFIRKTLIGIKVS